MNPKLRINPDGEAKRLAAKGLVANGLGQARSLDLNGAVASFQKAQELDPSLAFNPVAEASRLVATSWIARGQAQARSG